VVGLAPARAGPSGHGESAALGPGPRSAPARSVEEAVSPELALVDPELRRRLIRELASQEPQERHVAPTESCDESPAAPARPRSRRRVGLEVVLVPLVAAVGYSVAMLVSSSPPPSLGVGAARPSASAPSHHRRLAWAPVAGATAYDVALYAGSRRVYLERSRTASVQIGVNPGGGGTATVAPGTYEWYVWPVRHGRRDASAIVRSRLVLKGS
jgi:hypothetical protein